MRTAITVEDEINKLVSANGATAGDAYVLLCFMRAKLGADTEPFQLSEMEIPLIPGWMASRRKRAMQLLVKAGFIAEMEPAPSPPRSNHPLSRLAMTL